MPFFQHFFEKPESDRIRSEIGLKPCRRGGASPQWGKTTKVLLTEMEKRPMVENMILAARLYEMYENF